jgi:hypothetical protein
MLWADIQSNSQEVGKVLGGVLDYYRRGDIAPEARSALLKLHCSTNGRLTDRLATIMRALRPPRRPAPVLGLLGELSVDKQDAIAGQIARDGFYIFEQRLPETLCDEILQFAQRTPCTVEGRSREPKDRMLFDPAEPISKTYRVTEEDIVRDRGVQRLMGDPSVLALAERYLRTHPVLSMVNLWWSATFGNEPGADAAQEFHFDFDPPPRWLLFFVYLTDVGPQNGPHVYAKGTHLADIPAAGPLLARGYVRIPDKDIEAAFGKESIVELYGKRGTVLAVDTRGFHKGKMLTAGHRLMAQLTFSSPAYSGAHARKVKLPSNIDPALTQAIKGAPRVYEKYT